MAMHFIPVGIEADSKEEAEQKILKIQEVATEYVVGSNDKPASKIQPSTVYNPIWAAVAFIGLSWLEGYAEKAQEERFKRIMEQCRLKSERRKRADCKKPDADFTSNERKKT